MDLLDLRALHHLDLTGTAITAQVTEDGSLEPVSNAASKLSSAMYARAFPRIHTVVVAESQPLDAFGLIPTDTNPAILASPHADLHILQASSVAHAARLLALDAETRWGDIDCKLPAPFRFVGRERLIQAIDHYFATHESGYLVLTGALGKGKSALLVELVRRALARNEFPVFHLVGQYGSVSAQPYQVAACLYRRLQRKYGFPEPTEWGRWSAADKLEKLLQQISEFQLTSKREILYLDAADQIREPLIPEILRPLPPNVFCLITSRPALDWLAPSPNLTVWDMENYTDDRADVRAYLDSRLSAAHPLDGTMLDRIVSQPSPPVFFTVAERLRDLDNKSPDQVQQVLHTPTLWTVAPETLIAGEMWRVVRQTRTLGLDEAEVWQTLGLLALAREPLNVEHLERWQVWQNGKTERLLNLASNFFAPRPLLRQPDLPFAFAHPGYQLQILERLTPGERTRLHRTFTGAGMRWHEYEGALLNYALRYTAAHAVQANAWQELKTLLEDQEWVAARIHAGLVSEHIADLVAVHLHIPLERATQVLVQNLTTEQEGLALRRALSQFFDRYQDWLPPLRAALETSSDLVVLKFIADTLDMQQDYDAAAQVYEKMRAVEPADASSAYGTARIRLSSIYRHMGEPQRALAVLDEMFDLPHARAKFSKVYGWGQYHRALALYRLGQTARARAILQAIEHDTSNVQLSLAALHQLGVIALEGHDFAAAEKIFERALEKQDPGDWNYRRAHELRRLGQVYAQTGRPAQARTAFTQAMEISARCGYKRYVHEIEQDVIRWFDNAS